jgi:2-hydroxychromene-2-carboxylate isomerase
MQKQIDFYFDFISPFAYLAHVKLPGLAKKYGAIIHYHPIDVMLAKLAAGNYGPSTRDIPSKAKYIRADRLRWAALYGVPMVPVLNGARAPRLNAGTYYAIQQSRADAYVKAGFNQVWGLGMNVDDDATLTAVARELGWEPAAFLGYVNSPQAGSVYQEGQREAQKRGVFGSPIMLVDDQMYWGNDRLDFLETYLATAAQKAG